ncbi:MAG: hypothetical protein MHM6MM_002323 [Cercozoa sp. M6MM]
MGNQLVIPAATDARTALGQARPRGFAHIRVDNELGRGRLADTFRCWDESPEASGGAHVPMLTVKVHVRRDLTADLSSQISALEERRAKWSVEKMPSVLPHTRVAETPKAVFFARPYMTWSLFDRLHDRRASGPLSDLEKRWLVYQLLRAIAQVHSSIWG